MKYYVNHSVNMKQCNNHIHHFRHYHTIYSPFVSHWFPFKRARKPLTRLWISSQTATLGWFNKCLSEVKGRFRCAHRHCVCPSDRAPLHHSRPCVWLSVISSTDAEESKLAFIVWPRPSARAAGRALRTAYYSLQTAYCRTRGRYIVDTWSHYAVCHSSCVYLSSPKLKILLRKINFISKRLNDQKQNQEKYVKNYGDWVSFITGNVAYMAEISYYDIFQAGSPSTKLQVTYLNNIALQSNK